MKYELIDQVIELGEDRIIARKQVTLAEEYLADHFPTFPVLPGVLMIEAMVQAGRRLASLWTDERLVLGEVRALKFGSMVRPGEALRVEVTLMQREEGGLFRLKGAGYLERSDDPSASITACSGRFTLRPVRG